MGTIGFKSNKDLKTKEKLTIYGDSGTERYSGFFYEDPNPQWRDDQRVDIVENMRRTDGTIKAALTVVKTPMLGTAWDVVTDSENPRDIEINEFVKKCVMNMKGRTWKEFLREALTYLDFGFSVFEKVYGFKDDKLTIIDLQPRIQNSIYRWETLDGYQGVTQWVNTNAVDDKQGFIDIPMNKLVVFTNEKEGDDITGQSILRAAYKHFYAKDNLYRFGLISSERFGTGTLEITLPPDAGEEEKDEAINLGRSFKANEMAYVVKPSPDWDINIITMSGNNQSGIMEEQIRHHDREILMSVLAAFLDLGSGDSGSYALSQDQSSFFLKNVEDKLEYFSEKFTKEVIHDIVKQAYPEDYNRLKEEGTLPYLTYSPIGDKNLVNVSQYLKTLFDAGMIKPDVKMRKWVHDMFKLPEISEEELEEQRQEEELEPAKPDQVENEEIGQTALQMLSQKKKFELARPITVLEEKIDFRALNENFNNLESELSQKLKEFFEDSFNKTIKRAKSKINNTNVKGLANLNFISQSQLKAIIKDYVNQSLEIGKQMASEELVVERPKTPTRTTQLNNLEVEQIAEEVTTRINGEAKQSATKGLEAGIATAAILIAMRRNVEKEANRANSILSGSIIGENINKGRRIVFENNLDLVQAYMRSEILDSRTCNICMSLDKRVVKADDPFAQMNLVHNNCRGVWVPIKEGARSSVGTEGVPTVDDIPGVKLGIPKTIKQRFETVGGAPQRNAFEQLKKPLK